MNPPSVEDPSMVVNDRGSILEIMPTQRALPQTDASGHQRMQVVMRQEPNTPIGPLNLGVVFNHTLQQRGYISGEIAFKAKPGHRLSALDPTLYPGARLIIRPDVYIVRARTPIEFIGVLQRLQGRDDIAWVEPTVIYGLAYSQ